MHVAKVSSHGLTGIRIISIAVVKSSTHTTLITPDFQSVLGMTLRTFVWNVVWNFLSIPAILLRDVLSVCRTIWSTFLVSMVKLVQPVSLESSYKTLTFG